MTTHTPIHETRDFTSPDFETMLRDATTEPGTISAAYTNFHNYSLGNMILAMGQCEARGIPLGPLASFNRWKELGRHVTKGQKAIELCMPLTCKRDDAETGEKVSFTRFAFKRNWFVLAQTDGADYQPPTPADWDRSRALETLGITEIPFDLIDGNAQGYAKARTLAINPVATHPYKTLFHELAHILIGHTAEATMSDDDRTPRDLREVEAEGTAMLVCAALQLPGLEDSRGYMQHWYGAGNPIPEASARRIFKAADSILKAGRPADRKEA